MSSSSFLLFYHSLLLSLATLTLSQLEDIDYVEFNCSQTSANYTVNSPYESNLNTIISQFSTFTLSDYNYGFFNLSAGETPDRVNTIALCRADINQTDCYRFLNYTANELKRLCPRNKAAIAWTQYCFLRYSDRNIYGVLENEPRTCIFNTQNASNPSYNQLASNNLLVDLSNDAAASGPLRKYAGGNATVGDSQTVYASVQCTPDMDQRTCATCLTYARNELQSCCSGRIGCTVLRPTCVLRFEANPFNNEVAIPLPSPPSPTSPTPNGGNGNNTTRIIIIVIASVVGVLILNISICIFMRRRRKKPTPIKHETVAADQEIPGAESLQFDFDSLLVATNYFSDSNKLGQGGFGSVYKGQLPNGQEIAVKRLSIGSGQGDLEFKTEVVLVAKLQHRSLVRLLGFCLHGHEKLLIYEFVRNGSLDHFIFDRFKRAKLDWETRYKIIGGIARGLLYLHEDSRLRIIHRDLKASNILLDAEMIPKIADFGMARLFGQDETQGNTSRIVGTYGYMAPEYVCTGQFSVKSDVFSFGVLLLEIISGQKSNSFRHGEDDEYILSFAWRSWREGTALNLVDPTLADGSRNEIMRCIHIALLCVQENVAARPTMASVVLMLNSFSNTLELPSQPAFSMQSNFGSDMPSSMASTSKSNSDLQQLSHHEVSITELYPR